MEKFVVHIFYNKELIKKDLVLGIADQISNIKVKDIELVPNVMDITEDEVMREAYGISRELKRITAIVLDVKNNELFRAEGNSSTSILTTIQMGLNNYER